VNLLGSYLNVLGERVATGLSAGVLNTAIDKDTYFPVTGALVDNAASFLTTSGGDHISYAQD
jgi:hypothetical protein